MLILQTISNLEIYVLRLIVHQMADQETRVMDHALHQVDHDLHPLDPGLVPEVPVLQLLVLAAILLSASTVGLPTAQAITENKEAAAILDLLLPRMPTQLMFVLIRISNVCNFHRIIWLVKPLLENNPFQVCFEEL